MGKLVEVKVPQLFQGVSRQPAINRWPGQLQEAENAVMDIVLGGAAKRPGLHVKKFLSSSYSSSGDLAFHAYKRDTNEKYFILFGTDGATVHDLINGTTIIPNYPNGTTYLNCPTPAQDLRFLTIADTTFVLNTTVTVAALSPPGTTPQQGLAAIEIRQAFANTKYSVRVKDGTWLASTYTSAASDDTADVAAGLASQMTTDIGGSGWTITSDGSHVFIENDAGNDFLMELTDGLGGAMRGASWYAYEPEDLTPQAWDGQLVRIGTTEDEYYWVVAKGTDPGSVSDVRWVETKDPAASDGFDPATMPHILVRNGDGTFTFKRASWSNREAGDATTNPDPEFVGRTIRDVGFHRDRLVFATDEYVSFSRSGDYTNFWPNSVTQVIDSDPFSRILSGPRVNVLRHMVPFRKALWVTSDALQGEVSSTGPLTPTSAVMDASTNYQIAPQARPVTLGNELYFLAEREGYTQVYEYFYEQDTLSNTADDITTHVRGYIPDGIRVTASDPNRGMLFLLGETSGGFRDTIYVYKTYWKDRDKAQSSWSQWRITNSDSVEYIDVLDGELLVVVREDGNWYLESLPLDDYDDYPGFTAPIRLDHLETPTLTYDAGGDVTYIGYTFAPSFDTKKSRKIINLDTGEYVFPDGQDGTGEYLDGDQSSLNLVIGYEYLFRLIFGSWFLRDQEGNSILPGRLQVKHLTVRHWESCEYEVWVTPIKRSARQYSLDWRVEEGLLAGTQQPIKMTDTKRFPVKSNGANVQIELRSYSPTPANIIAVSATALFNERSRQG